MLFQNVGVLSSLPASPDGVTRWHRRQSGPTIDLAMAAPNLGSSCDGHGRP